MRDDGTVHRHLVLVRHAKSSWDDPAVRDHDRPLAPRGVRALTLLGDHLGRAEPAPALVLCSSARRTVDTLEGVRSSLPPLTEIRVDPRIYGASFGELLALLGRLLLLRPAPGRLLAALAQQLCRLRQLRRLRLELGLHGGTPLAQLRDLGLALLQVLLLGLQPLLLLQHELVVLLSRHPRQAWTRSAARRLRAGGGNERTLR